MTNMKKELNMQAESFTPTFIPKQMFIKARGMQFCVEERGDPSGPPIVLIMGFACQMTHWPESLLDSLAQQGHRVICFDNRDIGLSDKLHSKIKVDIRKAFLYHKLGFNLRANYTLHDMAEDTASLMAALEIENAHVVGVSMGGMIAQLLAAHYPNKVRSLTAIMSSTNSPKLPMPELGLMLKLSKTGPSANDMESVTKRWINFWNAVQSPGYPTAIATIRELMEANYKRNFSPAGTLRQLQAILATGSLEKVIRKINVPTLVIHGERDPLLKPACGKAISKGIKGAQFKLIQGMGHDLPEPLIPEFVRLISENVKSRC